MKRGRTTYATTYDAQRWAAKRGIIDDGRKGQGGPVKRYSPAELEAFAKARGATVSRVYKRMSTDNLSGDGRVKRPR